MKTDEDYFSDWESYVFGFGYGTGEEHVLVALRTFFDSCEGFSYNYKNLERILGPTVTWLLINALCHADIIEYGTSPRCGWMTYKSGRALHDFVTSRSVETLVDLANRDQDYTPCYPDWCNCDNEDCQNPFWLTQARRNART